MTTYDTRDTRGGERSDRSSSGRTFEAEITYVDGGLLPRLAETLRRPVPYLDLRVLWGDGDAPDFWAEAAREGNWLFRQTTRDCFEVTFPDGTHLLNPARAGATTVKVLSTTCTPAGMSTICTSRVLLRVPESDRGPAARCVPFRKPAPPEPIPSRQDRPQKQLPPQQAARVHDLLHRLRRHHGMPALSLATGRNESSLYKILRYETAPTIGLAFELADMIPASIADVVLGRVRDLGPPRPRVREAQPERLGPLEERVFLLMHESPGITPLEIREALGSEVYAQLHSLERRGLVHRFGRGDWRVSEKSRSRLP